MGARPSSFRKGGGGFLNNVDGVITGYRFTDEFNGNPFKGGRDPKTGKERFHSLYAALSARVDGATEDVTTTLFVGGADDFEIENDDHMLVPVEDGRELSADTAWGKFITSLVEAGFPETSLPEDEINYESIIGTRVRFVQRTNDADTKKLGKRKGKNGKEYSRQDLIVDQVYELATPAVKSNGKAAKPAKGKAVAAPAAEDIQELSGRALVEIVEAAGGQITKSKVSVKTLLTPTLKGNPQREEVRQWLADDSNLETLVEGGLITYNKAKGQIALAAE